MFGQSPPSRLIPKTESCLCADMTIRKLRVLSTVLAVFGLTGGLAHAKTPALNAGAVAAADSHGAQAAR